MRKMGGTRQGRIGVAVGGMLLLLFCEMAAAGSISGTVVFEGKAPKMRALAIEADPHCVAMYQGKEPPTYEFLVLGEGQTMANVLIRVVAGLPERTYPVPTEAAVLDQKGCMYSPHVLVVRPGQKLRILNPDGINHNVHAKPKVNTEFNRSMSKKRIEIEHTFTKAEDVFKINCDVHAWMAAYCVVMDHPFYAVTGIDGAFTIDNLDPGEYEIEAWQERLETQRVRVTITADEPSILDFTFKRPAKK